MTATEKEAVGEGLGKYKKKVFILQYHLDTTIIMKIQFSFTNYLEDSTVGFCVLFVLPICFPLPPCRDDTSDLSLSSM